MEDEAAAFGARARLDCADEEHMVAGGVAFAVAALERRDAAVDQRGARQPQPVGDAVEQVGMGRENRRASSTWSCASTLIV